MATLTLSKLGKSYGELKVFENLDLEVDDGEFLTLLGPSGCGKTTALRCIAGLEQPTEGSITIGSRVVSDPRGRHSVPPNQRDVGLVFQSYALWPHMDVFDNVAFPLRRAKVPRPEVTSKVSEMIASVGLADKIHRSVGDLSGGQQQRVALARALVRTPQILLCDEPLSNLDASLRRQMRDEILRLHNLTGTTVVYVTHDQDEAISLSDRVVVMNHGRIEQIGSPRDIFSAPANRFVANFIGVENVLSVHMATPRVGGSVDLVLSNGVTLLSEDTSGRSGPAIAACAIRSEDIEPVGAASTEVNTFDVDVVSSVYVGQSVEVRASLSDLPLTMRVSERHRTHHEFAPGSQIRVSIPPHCVLPLPA